MKIQFNKFVFAFAIAIAGLTGINGRVSSEMFLPEKEPDLNIESWMTEDSYWTGPRFGAVLETDPGLAIEQWMYNDDYWE